MNSSEESLRRVKKLTTAKNPDEMLAFEEVDLCDETALDKVVASAAKAGHPFTSCIHFAGLKAVGESTKIPLKYYHNNLTGTFNLISVLAKHGVKQLVFSSSATVYGSAAPPLKEDSPVGVGITNTYGRTKYMLEEVFRDVANADNEWGVVLLRYFNPVGAHPSGNIGEDPHGIPNNLMPYIQQVCAR